MQIFANAKCCRPGAILCGSLRFGGSAVGAQSAQHDMLHVHLDPVLAGQAIGQPLEFGIVELDYRLAMAAGEMMMVVDDVCPASSLVAQSHPDHQALIFQRFQRAIHGGGVDGGIALQNLGPQLLDAPVLMFLAQDLEYRDTRPGGIQAVSM